MASQPIQTHTMVRLIQYSHLNPNLVSFVSKEIEEGKVFRVTSDMFEEGEASKTHQGGPREDAIAIEIEPTPLPSNKRDGANGKNERGSETTP